MVCPAVTFTSYFFASARTAALRCSAITASVQSCSTRPLTSSNAAGLGARHRCQANHAQASAAGQRLPLAGRRRRERGGEVGAIALHDVAVRPAR